MDNVKDDAVLKDSQFSNRFKVLLWIAIFMTLGLILITIPYLSIGIIEKWWEQRSMNSIAFNSLFCICMIIVCISLVKIAIVKKPYIHILVKGIYAIGALFLACSVIFPLFPGYHASNFELISGAHKAIVDGVYFTLGILFLVYGRIMTYGFYDKNKLW